MAEGQVRIADEDRGALGDEGRIGENIGKTIYSMGCGAGRAYIGLGDYGSSGDGVEGSEGTDGRLPLYKKMAHTTE
jgi:hypothetical protein